jgi:predicted RNA-binding Zn-ribbon protein involved in translation (DUF1610 family)
MGKLFCRSRIETHATMGDDEGDDLTYVAYCPACGEEQEIYRTVPWQADFCTECGREVEAPEVNPEE